MLLCSFVPVGIEYWIDWFHLYLLDWKMAGNGNTCHKINRNGNIQMCATEDHSKKLHVPTAKVKMSKVKLEMQIWCCSNPCCKLLCIYCWLLSIAYRWVQAIVIRWRKSVYEMVIPCCSTMLVAEFWWSAAICSRSSCHSRAGRWCWHKKLWGHRKEGNTRRNIPSP